MTYTIEFLNDLPIYSLRTIGQLIGVRVPTKLKKAELIQEIIKVQEGAVEPFFTNRGRPKKASIENLSEEALEKRLLLEQEKQKTEEQERERKLEKQRLEKIEEKIDLVLKDLKLLLLSLYRSVK
ncbi:MAG: hypothetical protein IJV85_00950 [Clostridia bacterium]|nr:hypothetical protein [Clostridia bacterium]